ncbi:hypothetical protein CRYUN_Cryun01aG0098700 [Craigia yunnanensis]
MGGGKGEKATVIQTLLFVSGLSTLFQSVMRTRLPIVVVGSYAYLIPVISIIQASRYKSYLDPYEMFVWIMRGIQGALIIASCFQSVMGFLGLWRNAVRDYCDCFNFTVSSSLYRIKAAICDQFAVLFTVASTWLFSQLLSTNTNLRTVRLVAALIVLLAQPLGETGKLIDIYSLSLSMGSPIFNLGEAFVMMATSFVSLFEVSATVLDALFNASAAPSSSFEDGVKETGVSLAFTVRALDAGPVIARKRLEVDDQIKAPDLLALLFSEGSKLLIHKLPSIFEGSTKVRAFAGWPGTQAKVLVVDNNWFCFLFPSSHANKKIQLYE